MFGQGVDLSRLGHRKRMPTGGVVVPMEWDEMNPEQKIVTVRHVLDEVVLPGMDIAAQDMSTMDMRLTVNTQGLMALARLLGIDPAKFAEATADVRANNEMLKAVAEKSKAIFEAAEASKVDPTAEQAQNAEAPKP